MSATPPFRAVLLAAALIAALAGCGDRGEPGDELQPLSLDAAADSLTPHLSLSAGGHALVSWLEPAANGHRLRFSRLDDEDWTAPVTVASGENWFVNWADFPAVVAVGEATLVAHWLKKSGAAPYAYDVMLSVSADDGGTWSAPVRAHTDGAPTEHGFASFYPTEDGFGGVWLDGRDTPDGGSMTLREGRYSLAGERLSERQVDDRVCDCCQTDVVAGKGQSWLVYRDRSLSEIRDIALSTTGRDGFDGGRVTVADGWRIDGCPVNGPAVDALGAALAFAWFTGAESNPRVRLARSYDRGNSFVEATLETDGTPLGRVDIVVLSDGGVVLSWLESVGGDATLNAQYYDRLGRGGPVRTVTTVASSRRSGFPQMVLDRNRLVFAWTDADADATRVRTAVAPVDWFKN